MKTIEYRTNDDLTCSVFVDDYLIGDIYHSQDYYRFKPDKKFRDLWGYAAIITLSKEMISSRIELQGVFLNIIELAKILT